MTAANQSPPRNLLVSSHKKNTPPPHKRVKLCLPCWRIAFCLLVFFAANLVLLYMDLEKNTQQLHNNHPLVQSKLSYEKIKETKNQHERKRYDDEVDENENDKEGHERQNHQSEPDMLGKAEGFLHKRARGETVFGTTTLKEPKTTLASYVNTLKSIEVKTNKQSCRKNEKGEYSFNGDYCTDETGAYTYYNPLDFERLICGTKIPPRSFVHVSPKCSEPARIFPVIPDQTGQGMPPVLTGFGKDNGKGYDFPCDIPCLNKGNPSITCTRFVRTWHGDHWVLDFSMEGPQYYSQLNILPDAFKRNHFYSTTSYDSEVPLPYYSEAEYKIRGQAVDFDKVIKGASFMARNCNSKNNREKLVRDLQASEFRIDSLSSCLHNANPPPGVDLRNKVEVMRQYLFYLAFENQCVDDYITEKLWGPLESGTVPVYYGAPNVKDHVPDKAIIHVDDFESTADLAAYLKKVSENRSLYEEHQAWRSKPFPAHFHARYDFTKIHSTCRTCRWAYAKFYGLGWNHKNQSLRELETPRSPCIDAAGLLSEPVVEEWVTEGGAKLETEFAEPNICPFQGRSTTVDVDGGSFKRTVYVQDGTIDLLVKPIGNVPEKPIRIRLATPFPEGDEVKAREISDGHVRLQGAKTRYTVLSWPRLSTSSLKANDAGGLLEVVLPTDAAVWPIRFRVLVEDVETLRKGADQEENFFGKMMILDFYSPVETLR